MRQDEKSATSETDITIAFAEHLLGKLAPGESYTLDSRKEKKSCRCGCKKEPTYSCTGIGMRKHDLGVYISLKLFLWTYSANVDTLCRKIISGTRAPHFLKIYSSKIWYHNSDLQIITELP